MPECRVSEWHNGNDFWQSIAGVPAGTKYECLRAVVSVTFRDGTQRHYCLFHASWTLLMFGRITLDMDGDG